ncbi:non-specific serine/threonine protein kinase [Ranunculus cassubicifolius]
MAESRSPNRLLNFWKLHFQKIGLELKCSLCLNLLNQPILLPCDHIFCSPCVPKTTASGSDCPICFVHFVDKDLRPTPHMENILNIYKSMNAALGTIAFQTALQADTTESASFWLFHLLQSAKTSPRNPRDNKEADIGKGAKTCGSPNTCHEEDLARESKRQKLEFAVQNRVSVAAIPVDSTSGLDTENALISSETRQMPGKPLSSEQPPTPGNLHANPAFLCGFCQTSEVPEDYGPLVHYLNGKAVDGDKATHPNVLHVHSKCAEWTPEVHYRGNTLMNLESALSRAAKLKCNKCNLKGAGLGCVVESCRKSFHVPCAIDSDCRWDMENFVMLCPTHATKKFPSERSTSKKKKKHEESCPSPIQKDIKVCLPVENVWTAAKEWVICGSALSASEKNTLLKFAKIANVTIAKAWGPDVTHVIASTDGKGAFCRTLKVLMAILNGKWILNIDWIVACMEAMNPVNEEPYEINLDVYGCRDGPKMGRKRILEKGPKLFDGLNFYFSGYFEASYMGYLEELLAAAGGAIVTEDKLMSLASDVEGQCVSSVIVYNLDFPPKCLPEDKAFIRKQRHEEAQRLAIETRSWVVDHTWILESIAALKLQPYS